MKIQWRSHCTHGPTSMLCLSSSIGLSLPVSTQMFCLALDQYVTISNVVAMLLHASHSTWAILRRWNNKYTSYLYLLDTFYQWLERTLWVYESLLDLQQNFAKSANLFLLFSWGRILLIDTISLCVSLLHELSSRRQRRLGLSWNFSLSYVVKVMTDCGKEALASCADTAISFVSSLPISPRWTLAKMIDLEGRGRDNPPHSREGIASDDLSALRLVCRLRPRLHVNTSKPYVALNCEFQSSDMKIQGRTFVVSGG